MNTAVLAVAFVAFTAMSPVTASAQEPNFGRAVAMTDSELIVGQPVNWYGPGVVYTYRLDSSGEWTESSRLMASDATRKDDFGRALALDGNTLIVAAPRKHDGSGVVYAFERPSADGAWRQVGIIEPPTDGEHPDFGGSLALAGDELLVGAPADDSIGVVYRYVRTDGAWSPQGTIGPADGTGVAAFGAALGRDGDWLVVGAPASDSIAGKAYFFQRQASGDWTETSAAGPPADSTESRWALGATVLVEGSRAYVAGPRADAIAVFERGSSGAWTLNETLNAPEVEGRTMFGTALAHIGDELWVGAPGMDGDGRVIRYASDPSGGWLDPVVFDPFSADTAEGSAANASWPLGFGFSLAGAGNLAAVGMPFSDFGEGRLMVVERTGNGWRPWQTLEGEIYRIGSGITPGVRCEEGAIEEFPCANIEVVAHMQTTDLGGERGAWVNDVWGWTDPETKHDYALVARRDGTSFVDVTNPSEPRLVGDLPRTHGSRPSVWRDVKVLGNHAYVVSDGAGEHGMQVFDLTRLRAATDPPAVFEPDTTYHEIYSAHNVVADTASKFLYIVGANGGGETCGGGLHMVDATDPLNPTFAGCYNDTEGANQAGYTHDAQCLVYEGPDERYRGRQICVGSNQKEINIADVTDKENPETIGRNSYPNVAYAHQGWFDAEQRYFYMNDELDEFNDEISGTRTIVWDLTKLDDPIVAREYFGPVRSSDHNLYVVGDRVYESNYGSGLRVLDISDRTNPTEIAFFDSAPYNENGPGHSSGESGAWSNYPFFESGVVVFTSVREGLFIVRVTEETPTS